MRMKAGEIGYGKSPTSNRAKNVAIRRKKHKVHLSKPKVHGVGSHDTTLKASSKSQGISIGSYTGLDVQGYD